MNTCSCRRVKTQGRNSARLHIRMASPVISSKTVSSARSSHPKAPFNQWLSLLSHAVTDSVNTCCMTKPSEMGNDSKGHLNWQALIGVYWSCCVCRVANNNAINKIYGEWRACAKSGQNKWQTVCGLSNGSITIVMTHYRARSFRHTVRLRQGLRNAIVFFYVEHASLVNWMGSAPRSRCPQTCMMNDHCHWTTSGLLNKFYYLALFIKRLIFVVVTLIIWKVLPLLFIMFHTVRRGMNHLCLCREAGNSSTWFLQRVWLESLGSGSGWKQGRG